MAIDVIPSLPARVFYPRATVIMSCLFDDQVGGVAPATFQVIPRSVEVFRNSARKADTCRLEIDYRDFPLDPRTLQDVQISVHMESVRDPSLPVTPTLLNRRFVGLVDEPHSELGRDKQVVSIEARDFTGIWLDFKWGATNPAGTSVLAPTAIPTPPGSTLQTAVEYMRTKVTPLTPPAVFTDPVAAGTDVSLRTGRSFFTAQNDDESAWDVLCALCDLFGLVPVYDQDILTIRTPTEPGANIINLEYGVAVERLEFYRNLKQNKEKQVKIVAWNPVTGIPLEAVYPPIASVLALNEKGKLKPTTKQVQYNVEGLYDPATLALLAQRVYTEITQNVVMGELETRELRDPLQQPLMSASNGDILFCRLGTADQGSIASMSPAEQYAFLSDPTRTNSLNPAAAQALVQSWNAAQRLSSKFYILEAVHKWDREDGYRLTIRFRDFILGA
ncbi:MAG: hypothetical protein ABL912_01895 [Novosphingobium sp.]